MIRILMLFPLLVLFVLVELVDALGGFAYEIGEIWIGEDWQSQVASVAIWFALAGGAWWLL